MSVDLPAPASATGQLVLLADGTTALVRPLDLGDHQQLINLHEQASDDSFYKRFFSSGRASARVFVDTICSADASTFSLVAVRHGAVVGVATAMEDGHRRAEVALLVEESLHGMGVGSTLLEQLAREARARGIESFTADVLMQNSAMLRVFHDLGFGLREQHDHGVLSLSMDLALRPEAVAAADTRRRHSTQLSLHPLVEPGSVVVVGVSRHRGSVGREVVENVIEGGYAGTVYAVGRPDLALPGVHCVSELETIPRGVDLGVVAVPGNEVETVVSRLAETGVHTCVVLTSGMAETGAAGVEIERRLANISRAHDMRLVGPNCFGVLTNHGLTHLNATFGDIQPPGGSLAIGSQSGGVGIALLDAAAARNLGIASFVSLGNKADVSGNDLLALWYDDPTVRAAALYLESFHDPRTFARMAAGFSRSKPLLVVFGGSSAAGVRAGVSHTAAHAAPAAALQAMYRAAGIIDVADIDDLVDTAALLTEQPPPRGPRLGIVSNAGGLGILAADAAHRQDLLVPEPSTALRDRLEAAVPAGASFGNPIDLGAGATAQSFSAAATTLADSREVDALLIIVAGTAVTDTAAVLDAVEHDLHLPVDLPCLSVVVGTPARPIGSARSTRFRTVDAAVRSLAHASRWSGWRSRGENQVRLRAAAARDEEDTASTSTNPPAAWLLISEAERLLASAGVPLAPYVVARTEREVARAAHHLGAPLVLKTADPTVVHKTDKGLVVTGVLSGRQALTAARAIRDGMHETASPLIVQKQLVGPELAYGIVRDPTFGPLVMVSSGGTSLDLWDDQVFLMPPLDVHDIRASLARLRTWPLLTGFRGSKPMDVQAVVRQVQALGELALQHPELLEMDLNPIVVTADGPVCVDAKVRVRAAVPKGLSALRG